MTLSCALVASVLWWHLRILCLSHTWAILCSFSLSNHCSHQCFAPKPQDPRTAQWPLPRRRALSERAKLKHDSAGHRHAAPLSVYNAERGGWTAAREGKFTSGFGSLWLDGWGFCQCPCPPTPFVISLRSPYQQICELSTLLIFTDSKYSNLEFSLF